MENLETLKREIECKIGRKLLSPGDFDTLYLMIRKETGREISVSTLKRIWGYVKYDSKPRVEILSILSRFLGFSDWQDFIHSDRITDVSDFLSKDIIESKNLTSGDIIRLAWAPNRECELKYLEKDKFIVLKSENSKLQKGDIINCSIFAKGEPMLCSSIERNEKAFAEGYIAARRRGLQSIKLVKK